jgi:hypothetical protein
MNLCYTGTPELPLLFLLTGYRLVRNAVHTVAKAIDSTKLFFLNVADSYPSTIFLLKKK